MVAGELFRASSCASISFEVKWPTEAEEGRDLGVCDIRRRDFVLRDRGSIDGLLFEAGMFRASEDFVGDNQLPGTDLGILEGLTECSTGCAEDTSSTAARRCRLAGLVSSGRSEGEGGIDLNGLIEEGLPMKGGGTRPGVPLPAVRGRSGSSRPALEPLRFND